MAGPDAVEGGFSIVGLALTGVPDFDEVVGEADKHNGVRVGIYK